MGHVIQPVFPDEDSLAQDVHTAVKDSQDLSPVSPDSAPNTQPVASSPIILKTTHEVDGDSSSILELRNWCTERLGNLPKGTQIISVSR